MRDASANVHLSFVCETTSIPKTQEYKSKERKHPLPEYRPLCLSRYAVVSRLQYSTVSFRLEYCFSTIFANLFLFTYQKGKG